MSENRYRIGELARLSGVSVRRIRFYSDKGILPPATRTASGYRVYTDMDVARLDLVRALREAGIGLAMIRKLIGKRLSLHDVLKTRLEALEAEIAARRRIAAVLRATLRTSDPTEADLRRLWTMTTLTNARLRSELEAFFDKVAEDAHVDPAWKRQMLDLSAPELPAEPTADQIDAWNELTAMISDPDFIAEMRADMATMWRADFDPEAYLAASQEISVQVREAIAAGRRPESPEGLAIARHWLQRSAAAMNRAPDAAFLDWHLDQYRRNSGRTARYRLLLARLQGTSEDATVNREWAWMIDAMKPLLETAPGA